MGKHSKNEGFAKGTQDGAQETQNPDGTRRPTSADTYGQHDPSKKTGK